MLFSFQILSFILATLLCIRHRRERSSFLHMTARCSFDPCAGRSCVWGTALPRGVGRFKMASACALAIISGKNIFISRLSRSAERSKRYFHRRGRKGKRQVQRRFLRKRGAAGKRARPLSQALSGLPALPKGEPRALPETSSLCLIL